MAGECDAAAPAQSAGGQVYYPVTEQEEKAARLEAIHRKWSGRMVFLVCALPLAVLAAWGILQAWPVLFPGEGNRRPAERVETMVEASAAAERREIQTSAQRFLTAASWQEMLPAVADAERVKGVMAWYYLRHPHQPAAGETEVKAVLEMEGEGRQRRRVLVVAPNHPPRWLLVSLEAGTWKVDWEVFAGANQERWKEFLREPGGTSVELPLLVALKPAADAYILGAGRAPGTHKALVLWAMERSTLAGAVLETDSSLWKSLPEIGFENAVKVIVRVRMVNPEAEPPLVRLERVVREGWLR